MNKNMAGFGSLVTGCYAWVTAVFFGGILLDVTYSNALKNGISVPEREAVFSTVSDALLCLGAVIIPAGLGSVAVSWRGGTARNLFTASLILVSFEFITPVLFSTLFQGGQDINIGPWLRIVPAVLGSMLAFTGVYFYYRQSG